MTKGEYVKLHADAREVFFSCEPDPPWTCVDCLGPITKRGRSRGSLHVHHVDHDHFNNDFSNLAPMHHSCHVSGHVRGVKDSWETRRRKSTAAKRREAAMTTDAKRIRAARTQETMRSRGTGIWRSRDWHAQGGCVTNALRVVCAVCGMISNPGAMGVHFKATGHWRKDG